MKMSISFQFIKKDRAEYTIMGFVDTIVMEVNKSNKTLDRSDNRVLFWGIVMCKPKHIY